MCHPGERRAASLRQRGTALVAGLLLLSVITLLGLAGASAAQVQLRLARNEQFRENAASAASAGIEIAISHVTSSAPESVPARVFVALPADAGSLEVETRFIGYENSLPQLPGAQLAAAHFDIVSTGHAARGALDCQRARVVLVVESSAAPGADCEPIVPGVRCAVMGELRRLSWQRLPAP
jgi:Tfp pilus assembly protein PilX